MAVIQVLLAATEAVDLCLLDWLGTDFCFEGTSWSLGMLSAKFQNQNLLWKEEDGQLHFLELERAHGNAWVLMPKVSLQLMLTSL